jgi:predicted nuclease with TOPRIM domain
MNESLDTRVALLEERVKQILENFDGLGKFFTVIKETSNLEQRVALLEAEVEVLESKLLAKVDKNEFWPVKSIVYGGAAIVLLAVLGTV